MPTEQDGLNSLLVEAGEAEEIKEWVVKGARESQPATPSPEIPVSKGRSVQWTTQDEKIYVPTGRTVPRLEPGVYDIGADPNIGLYFERVPTKVEGLLRFPDSVTHSVTNEIRKFWDSEHLYRRHDLAYKRGVLLYGPPGTGKSSVVQLLTFDVVERGGIVIRFGSPGLFTEGVRRLRDIQPQVPLVVTMEDMDSIIQRYSETEVLNILDGIERVDHTVFVATTNYPERLGARIVNRPSRFDKRFLVRFPNAASRKMYLEHIAGDSLPASDIGCWVSDTKGFSLAHLKELFCDVVIFGSLYADSVETLRKMSVVPSSDDDSGRSVGFRGSFLYHVDD